MTWLTVMVRSAMRPQLCGISMAVSLIRVGKDCGLAPKANCPAFSSEERHADRGDENGELGLRAQRPIAELFNDDADERANRHRREEGHQRRGPIRRLAAEPGFRTFGPDVEPGKSAEHVHIAVREVDEAQHSKDHRVTERDQGVDRAQGDAVDELLKKLDQLLGAGGSRIRRLRIDRR